MKHTSTGLPMFDGYRRDALTAGVFFVLTLVLGFLSNGVHHDDDLVHFLMARWSWWYPSYLLNVWGRPGMTVPLATVSWLSDVETAWHAARVLSAAVSAASALVAARLAARLGMAGSWRVVVACYAQPLFAVLGFTTLTENFTALYLVFAVALLARQRPIRASAIFSLALLTRHEAVLLVPIWAVAILLRRGSLRTAAGAMALSLWAPAMHNILSRIFLNTWPIAIFLQPSGSTQYLATGWSAYFPQAWYAMTPVVFVLAVLGGVVSARRREWSEPAPAKGAHAANFLVVAIPLAFLVGHVCIKAVGIYASGGFARFMVAVGPLIGILAVRGWDGLVRKRSTRRDGLTFRFVASAAWLFVWIVLEREYVAGRLPPIGESLRWFVRGVLLVLSISVLYSGAGSSAFNSRFGRRAYVGLMGLMLLVQWSAMVRPLKPGAGVRSAAAAARRLLKLSESARPVFCANPWIVYGLGLVENPRAFKNAALLASMPAGTLVVWDFVYSGSDYHGLSLVEMMGSGGFRFVTSVSDPRSADSPILLFEKTAFSSIPLRVRQSYPPPHVDGYPPVRGVFYQHDARIPTGFLKE